MASCMAIDPNNTIILLCDLQEKFRPAIHGFEHVVNSVNKVLKFAKVLRIPVVVTTQYAKALGETDRAVDLASLEDLLLGPIDKTLFSMLTPEVQQILTSRPNVKNVILMGIEAHICVLQTSLSILDMGLKPYVLADGISSTSPHEPPIALALLRQHGAVVTTSESIGFLLVKDASREGFKAFSNIVKEEKERTTKANEFLLGSSTIKSAM